MQLKRQFFLRGIPAPVLVLLLGLSTGVCVQSSRAGDADTEDAIPILTAAHTSVVRVAVLQGEATSPERRFEFGTGLLVHPAGYILTCAHVVRDNNSGNVTFHSGEVRPLSVVARIPQRDVALLKTQPPDSAMVAAPRLDRSPAEGESVFTIANIGNDGLATVRGNIAAIGRRTRTDFTQTDDLLLLAIPAVPGVSGGPVFDARGQFLAIVFAFAYGQPGHANSFAHAIGTSQLTAAVCSFANLKSSFGLGLGFRLDETADGCRVREITPSSAATDAELEVGDIIVRVAEWDVRTMLDFVLSSHAWAERGTNRPLELTIQRADERFTRSLTLALERPESIPSAASQKARLGCQLVVTELDRAGNEGRVLLRAWVRSLDGVWAQLGERKQPYRAVWSGYLRVPFDGAYTFYLATPGPGRLRLAGELLAEKTADFPVMRVAGRQYLPAGMYPIELSMKGGEKPTQPPLYVEGPGIPLQVVPDHWLWTESLQTAEAP